MTSYAGIKLKVKISDILHEAADKYLTDDNYDNHYCTESYSCNAIKKAARNLTGENNPYCVDVQNLARYSKYTAEYPHQQAALKFVKELGVKVGSSMLFDDVDDDKRQSYRYAWLKTAAMVAEEEGL